MYNKQCTYKYIHIYACNQVKIHGIKNGSNRFSNSGPIFTQLAPQKTIFASNTSSIPITEIASKCTRKDRFGGLHFFSPVPMMRLLEVIRISDTSDETYHKMDNWGKSIGKVTVTCKDTPGFIVNRLLIPYSIEAVRMVERGNAYKCL